MTYIEFLTRIEKAMLANFDEVTEHDEPYICLSLVDEFPVPKRYRGQDGDFVDELSGELQPDGGIEGIIVCISRKREDCTERVDEIDLADLEDDELRALAETVEIHKGERKVFGHLQLVTWFRSFCFDIANSGKHGTYPTDIGKFNEEVEKGFSDDGESWTAIDGHHFESALKKLSPTNQQTKEMGTSQLNTIRSKEDAQRLSRLGYVFTEGDRVQDGTTYPTLPAAQGFLRERLGIIVMPVCLSYNNWRYKIVREDWQNCRISEPEMSEDNYVSHDYALLAGIRKVLESENK